MFKQLFAVAALATMLAVPASADKLFTGVPDRIGFKWATGRIVSFYVQFKGVDRVGRPTSIKFVFGAASGKDIKDHREITHALSVAEYARNTGAFLEIRIRDGATRDCIILEGCLDGTKVVDIKAGDAVTLSTSYLDDVHEVPPGNSF